MRFGRNFPWTQIPRWADFYVNYDKWKFLAKAAKFKELKEAVACDSLVIENFLYDKNKSVAQYLSILNVEYGITLEACRLETLYCVLTHEKDDITGTLTDICSLLIYLGDYISVTKRAVERIKTKTIDALYEVEKLGEILEVATAQWVKDLQGINTILQTLHRSNQSSNKRSTSLLLSNLGSGGPIRILEDASKALQRDSADCLEKCLQDEALKATTPGSQAVFLLLAKIGILCSSYKCLPLLVSILGTNHDPSQFSSQNPLRLHILHTARLGKKNTANQDAYQGVRLLLDNLPSTRWSDMLLCLDSLGRLPLHYAAQYGMPAACSEIIERLGSVVESPTKGDLPIFLISDQLGETPLSIAITHGHAEILKLFLHQLRSSEGQPLPSSIKIFEGMFHDVVSLAIRSQHTNITEILMDWEPQFLTLGSKIHELLYLACQYGQASIVGRLSTYTSDINVGEKLTGRTPLMVASIYEHTDVVRILLAHSSCDIGVRDHSGWTAIDHAAFRGTPDLVKILQGQQPKSYPPPGHIQYRNPAPKTLNHASMAKELDGQTEDRSHIFMNLGHFDMEKASRILQIDPFRQLLAPMQVPDSSLTLEISAINCDADRPYLVSFPVLEDLCNDPFYFTTKDPNTAKLLFKVYSSVLEKDTRSKKMTPIGSAVVSLRDLRQGLGLSLESLERDHTVSLISSDAFGNEYIGSLTFTFVISNPFMFQGQHPAPLKMEFKRDTSPLVAGHRGLGQNNANQDRLQLDVQVTRDLKPVIYHDFLVSETGTDAPMHTLTYEQFMVPSTMQDRPTRPPGRLDSLLRTADPKIIQRPRSSSQGALRPDNIDVIARLMSTFNVQQFGFKGNIAGECIHAPFTTLQQLLVQIDASVCFDIELKYPMLFEARDFNMDTFAMELNLYLDTILEIVYKYGGKRPMFFTSFSPELCMLLTTKQQLYPVMFLTESGYIPTRDIRAISFQEAVRFAKKWNLEGVVIRSQPIMASPMLIDLVKSQGLVCASWGDLNDDPECAKIQADSHLDVIITNKVGEVVKVLGHRKDTPAGSVQRERRVEYSDLKPHYIHSVTRISLEDSNEVENGP
ncbi:Glycerophosphoryl diester phosphodiesterase family-domain-containing protein [Nemania diffusa]|nr:Glycerophosphoryl diester phosphodiesterase family-domain-containing protein [Nemania diffusa]